MKIQEPLNLSQFRKNQSIPANLLRSICSSLQIETEKIDGMLFANAFSKEYGINTDTLLVYAFQEYENTGEMVNTISKNFIDIKMGTGNNAIWVSIGDIEEQIRKQRSNTTTPPEEAGGDLVPVPKTSTIRTRSIPSTGAGVVPMEQGEVLSALVKALVEGQKPLLSNYEELSKAVEKNWLLTSEVLGQLLGMSKSTISSKGASFRKLGYEFEKVKEGSTTLWRVRQY